MYAFTQHTENVKKLPPAGFERLCQHLLREAGFEKVTVTGRSGDGCIDGNGVLQINPFVSPRKTYDLDEKYFEDYRR
jgi:hypothetical protein